MDSEAQREGRSSPEYLAQLLKDKKQIQALPHVFVHAEKVLDEVGGDNSREKVDIPGDGVVKEINRVRLNLFHHQGSRDILDLPEAQGPVVQLQAKLFVPVKDYPDFNFVGRILGPRGMTAKELEQFTGCKIMVRGKGSMRDKAKEDQNRGKANWEHLNDDLHVLITAEDTRNRAEVKLVKAKEEVKKLLVPAPDGEDDLKKRQLMELAIMNGTYRDTKIFHPAHLTHPHLQFGGLPMFLPPGPPGHMALRAPGHVPHLVPVGSTNFSDEQACFLPQPMAFQMRTPGSAGTQIILASRLPPPSQLPQSHIVATSQASMNGAPPPLVSPPGEHAGLMYNPYNTINAISSMTSALPSHMDPFGMTATSPSIIEYQTHMEQTHAGSAPKVRRSFEGGRGHPYGRVTLS